MSSRLGGVALIAFLALPAMRQILERVMALHMLVQIPLLAVAGGLVAAAMPLRAKARVARWNTNGISGTLTALIASSWWMVPRALDWTLVSPAMETAKFLSLPLLVGVPIALSWSELGAMGRGLVLANVLPMWAVVGWLYVAAPVRVCNFYLVGQQVAAGAGLLAATMALSLAACVAAFTRAR